MKKIILFTILFVIFSINLFGLDKKHTIKEFNLNNSFISIINVQNPGDTFYFLSKIPLNDSTIQKIQFTSTSHNNSLFREQKIFYTIAYNLESLFWTKTLEKEYKKQLKAQ